MEETLFLHPTASDEPSYDPVVHGTVTLNLSKPRAVKYLEVKLIGRQDIGWPSSRPYESTTTIERVVSLFKGEDGETVLEKGEHTFVSRTSRIHSLPLILNSSHRRSLSSCRVGLLLTNVVSLGESVISLAQSSSSPPIAVMVTD